MRDIETAVNNVRGKLFPLISLGCCILMKELRNVLFAIEWRGNIVTDCCPCRSVLSYFQGKEIAATTANSDGLPLIAVYLIISG